MAETGIEWIKQLRWKPGDRVTVTVIHRGPIHLVLVVVRGTVSCVPAHRPRWQVVLNDVYAGLKWFPLYMLHSDEEGIRWARGWYTQAARALRAVEALA